MLDKILNSWPRGWLAAVLIVGGVALLFMFSPPHSVCQSQLESFRQSEKGFLFLNKKQKQTGFEHLLSVCREANSPGGCYELFQAWSSTLSHLKKASFECSGAIAQNARLKKAVWSTLKLMLQIDRMAEPSWLDASDQNLFCQFKAIALQHYGQSTWKRFKNSVAVTSPDPAAADQGAKTVQASSSTKDDASGLLNIKCPTRL